MKKILLALALTLLPSLVWAQCNGQFPASTICGNSTGSPKLPSASAAANFINALLPTPTRAGDIIYWNGSTWVALAGNNSGTQILSETSLGVPSWITSITISGTPAANQVAQWTNASTVQGVNEASLLAAGNGISVTGTTTATLAVSLSQASNVLGSDIALNNTANYFDGPSMAQGTTGTWFASGSVIVEDTGAAANIACKLWDGTTVIASGEITQSASGFSTISLSGILVSPAANMRISCRDLTNTTGLIKFNASGNSKDSTIYGFRIQ